MTVFSWCWSTGYHATSTKSPRRGLLEVWSCWICGGCGTVDRVCYPKDGISIDWWVFKLIDGYMMVCIYIYIHIQIWYTYTYIHVYIYIYIHSQFNVWCSVHPSPLVFHWQAAWHIRALWHELKETSEIVVVDLVLWSPGRPGDISHTKSLGDYCLMVCCRP